jgi:dsDNA-specific endonuclease/ATPase MutS2
MIEDIINIELNDELDLHYFHAKDANYLVQYFIDDAFNKGKSEIKIVHGKGRSILKKIVTNELKKNTKIAGFKDDHGNWGATIVYLKKN